MCSVQVESSSLSSLNIEVLNKCVELAQNYNILSITSAPIKSGWFAIIYYDVK
jgi:hypothetical protein